MVADREPCHFCLRNSGHRPSANLLFWNRDYYRLRGFGRGNCAFGLCLSHAQHWGFSLAHALVCYLRNGGNLSVNESALEPFLAGSAPGDSSPPGRHLATQSLFSAETITSFHLAVDRWRRNLDSRDLDRHAMAASFDGDNRSVDRH